MSVRSATTALAAGRWRLDPTLSTVSFVARELGMIRVQGSLPLLEGWVDVDDRGAPVAAGGSLDVAGVDTGNPRRDRDLRSARFLDAGAWPSIRFLTSGIRSAAGGWTASGTMRAKGLQVPLTWEVTPSGPGFEAAAAVDLPAVGIRVPGWLIQHRVQVRLSAAVTLPPP